MQYCEKCKVSIHGHREYCPLCQERLSGSGRDSAEVFPFVENPLQKYHLVMRLIIFISFAIAVVSVTVNVMFPVGYKWSIFVVAAIPCMWLCLYSVMLRRGNTPKNILWMVFLLSVLAVGWDFFTGWHRWSLNYVIPVLCMLAMGAMAVIAKVFHLRSADYMIYFILDSLFGIVPLLFLLTGWATIAYPSVVCVAASVLSLAALLTFEGENLILEIKKRLHI